jgi:demethylmenaquinone methyltransferase/2-methoxy-6-polyprenyl-1,4-benzoquinol methylase
MRALESAPERYDRGIQILSRGRIDSLHQRLAEMLAAPGRRILDVGCGTGGVSLACAARGAEVVGIDINRGMLQIARAKAAATTSKGSVEWLELGAAEIADRFDASVFDGVVSCLTFSELSEQEQEFTLRLVVGRLKPGGDLVLADEVVPIAGWTRLRYRLQRAVLVTLAYVWAQTITHPVVGIEQRVRGAGFSDIETTRLWSGELLLLRARRPGGSP